MSSTSILAPLKKTAQTSYSSNGYSIVKTGLTQEQIDKIKSDLTIMPNVCPGYGNQDDVEPVVLWQENAAKLYVPRYYGYKKLGVPKSMKLTEPTTINVPFKGDMREYQRQIVAAWDSHAQARGGGIINVGPGRGKTVMAIKKITELGLKTLILVHNTDLLDQWKERIEQYAPTARVGIIQAKKLSVMNKDIVIGMIQSISNPAKDKEYPAEMFKEFGLLIVDECHHIAARMFSRCLRKTCLKYTMGLSATPDRNDGLTRVLKYYLGDICYKDDSIQKTDAERELDHIPDADVRIYQYYNIARAYSEVCLNYQKKPNVTIMENHIAEFEPRTDFMLGLIPPLIAEGRKIIILTSRRDHIATILEKITERGIATCGPYVGGMKRDTLNDTKTKQILVATYKMAEEGFDCQALDTLIMATPKKEITQCAGRIMRKSKNDRTHIPLIIDIADQFSSFIKWGKQRQGYYTEQNYRTQIFKADANRTPVDITEIQAPTWKAPGGGSSQSLPKGDGEDESSGPEFEGEYKTVSIVNRVPRKDDCPYDLS